MSWDDPWGPSGVPRGDLGTGERQFGGCGRGGWTDVVYRPHLIPPLQFIQVECRSSNPTIQRCLRLYLHLLPQKSILVVVPSLLSFSTVKQNDHYHLTQCPILTDRGVRVVRDELY